jgi:predicted N-acyltransferase
MLKLHVSESWMMSRRHADIRRERVKVESAGMRLSLLSGAERRREGRKGVEGESVATGSRKEERIAGMDFVV